jgi:hypothetical protein
MRTSPGDLAMSCRWRQLPSLPGVQHATLTYLPDTHALASFGGVRGGTYVNDLYTLSTTEPTAFWQRVEVQDPPAPRSGHSAVLRLVPTDSQELVIYGGNDETGQPLNDVRKLEFSRAGNPVRWSEVATGGPFRTNHTATWLPRVDEMIVFAGRSGATGVDRESDTWPLRLGHSPRWNRYSVFASSVGRDGHSAVRHVSTGRIIAFGGRNDRGDLNNWVYAFTTTDVYDQARWSRLEVTGTDPAPRTEHGAAYFPDSDVMVVAGGTLADGHSGNDVYALDLSVSPAAWTRIFPAGVGPGGLTQLAATYEADGRGAVFQGVGRSATDSETWSLACSPGEPPDTPTPTAPPLTATRTAVPTATPTSTPDLGTPTATWPASYRTPIYLPLVQASGALRPR